MSKSVYVRVVFHDLELLRYVLPVVPDANDSFNFPLG